MANSNSLPPVPMAITTYTVTNPEWYAWLSNKRAHTCSCGHVSWAHWPNLRCAHCPCTCNDADPQPCRKIEVPVNKGVTPS